MTLFVARTRKPFLSKPYPAPILLGASLSTQAIAALIVGFGWLVAPIAWKYVGFVWVYCLGWVFIEDWAKLQVYRHLDLSSQTASEVFGPDAGNMARSQTLIYVIAKIL